MTFKLQPTGLQASDRYLTSPCVKPPNPWQAVSGSNAGSLRGLESKSTLPRCMEMCESTDLMMQPDKQSQFQVRCISCKTLIHSIFAILKPQRKNMFALVLKNCLDIHDTISLMYCTLLWHFLTVNPFLSIILRILKFIPKVDWGN